jgi:hypothetical protein
VRSYAKAQNYDIVLSGEAVLWGDSSTRRCGLTTAIFGSAQAGSTASAAAAPINPTVNFLLIERFTDNYLPLHVSDFGPHVAGQSGLNA